MKKKHKYEIITLGGNCGPRGFLTSWNLIPTKSKGRKSLPFDLSLHPTRIVTQNIKEDFKHYLTGLRYGYKSGNRFYWTNYSDLTIYFHDYPNKLNSHSKIVNRYNKRICNFRKYSKKSEYVFYLIACLEDTTVDDLNELYNSLKEYRKKPFTLMVWADENIDITKLNSKIKIIAEHNPMSDNSMNVWDKTRVASQQEIDYKEHLKQFVISTIKEAGFEVEYFTLSLTDKIKFYCKYTLPKLFSITNNWVDCYKVLILFGLKINLWKIYDDEE